MLADLNEGADDGGLVYLDTHDREDREKTGYCN